MSPLARLSKELEAMADEEATHSCATTCFLPASFRKANVGRVRRRRVVHASDLEHPPTPTLAVRREDQPTALV